MPNIRLLVVIDPGKHWMLPWREIATFSKTIHVEDINAVKFTHTRVHSSLFSSSSELYDAIRYGSDLFRLQFDIKSGEYTARVKYSYSQGAQRQDWVAYWREKEYGDWDAALTRE